MRADCSYQQCEMRTGKFIPWDHCSAPKGLNNTTCPVRINIIKLLTTCLTAKAFSDLLILVVVVIFVFSLGDPVLHSNLFYGVMKLKQKHNF